MGAEVFISFPWTEVHNPALDKCDFKSIKIRSSLLRHGRIKETLRSFGDKERRFPVHCDYVLGQNPCHEIKQRRFTVHLNY